MVRKDDVIRTLDERDEQAYRTLVGTIDRRLPAYDGKRAVAVAVPKDTSDKVVDRIIRDYALNGGWTARRDKGDDQRDGGWDNLVFS